ncbi:MAG TPA: hypothetical protein VNJ07_12305 [Chitinophagales bacterium]|nr:hypothetical protein [Chitinophagales bacterium]
MKKVYPFLIVPVCVYLAVVPLRQAWGHYYYALHSDPSYLYLFNGLNIAMLKPSAHVDNPGSPVQLISAAVVRTTSFLRNEDDLQKDVILHSELYIKIINRTLFTLCIIALFFLGVVAYRYTGSLWWSFLLQCVPFASWQMMRIFLKVSPEMMIFISCILWIVTLLRLSARDDFRKNHLLYTFWFSFLTGFSLAAKLTMIPFLIIPLTLLPLRISVNYLLLSFIFFLLLIFPAWAHFEYLLSWLGALFIHSSLYGRGAPNVVDFPEALHSLAKLITLEHPLYIAVFLAAGLLMMIYRIKMLRDIRYNMDVKILFALVFTVVIQLVMVAKHFNPHYLIPSLSLFTAIMYFTSKVFTKAELISPDSFSFTKVASVQVMLVLMLFFLFFLRHFAGYLSEQTFREWISETLIRNSYRLAIAVVIFLAFNAFVRRQRAPVLSMNNFLHSTLIILAFVYCLRHTDIEGFRRRLVAEAHDSQSVMNMVNKRYNDYTLILGDRSSSLVYALKYGANENIPQPEHFERMKSLLTAEAYFWHYSEKFKTWTEETSLKEILRQNKKVILECDNRFTPREKLRELEQNENVSLEKVYSGKSAELYVIHPQPASF